MASSAGGIGFLLVLGLVSVGYANAGRGSAAETVDTAPAADSDGLGTCDGVLVVDSASGSARVPGEDTDVLDGTATPVCEMGAGDGDEDAVAVLQESLVSCHGQAVTIDGEYGPQTAEAVTAVQRQAGIEPDGEYGPATLEVMRWPVDGTAQAADCVVSVSPGSVVADDDAALPATR